MDWSGHVFSKAEAGDVTQAVVESTPGSAWDNTTTPRHPPLPAAPTMGTKDDVEGELPLLMLWSEGVPAIQRPIQPCAFSGRYEDYLLHGRGITWIVGLALVPLYPGTTKC